jgi:uncharacterized ion transporter superfamily protein YfcC
MKTKEKKGLNISTRSFITSISVIFILMVLTYILTFLIPGGEYARTTDSGGNSIIDTASGFSSVQGGIPFWKWILSPFLVLGAEGGGTIIAIIVFLLIIGGVFNSLDKCGLMKYMLDKIVHRFGSARYQLLAGVSFFFMAMGAFVGSFEEVIPLVPIVVALSISLGWDALTGLGMSLLSVGCGFASGVCNPFTVGVAQKLSGLPVFSGIWFRAFSFVLIYGLIVLFLVIHTKKIEKADGAFSGHINRIFVRNKRMDAGLWWFAGILVCGIVLIISSGFIAALQDYTMIIVLVMFLAAGISSSFMSGVKGKDFCRTFKDGMISILPAIAMILMAGSVKYTLVESHVLDTILHWSVITIDGLPKPFVILFMYLVALVINFFIPSGSAEAFLLIPLLVPIAQVCGIGAQLCIVAFAYGDGFSNVLYPTNPVLLIGLGLADVGYGKWIKYSWKFQLANFILTSMLLLLGLAIGYR